MKLLSEKGADVNVKLASLSTPLHFVAGFGHVEMADCLISKGADVNARNTEGGTPMHWAVFDPSPTSIVGSRTSELYWRWVDARLRCERASNEGAARDIGAAVRGRKDVVSKCVRV